MSKHRKNYFNLPQQLFDSIMDDLNPGQTVYINPDPNETEDHHYLTYTVYAQRKPESEVYREFSNELADLGNFCDEVERRTGKKPDQKIIQAIRSRLFVEKEEEEKKKAAEYAKQKDIFGNPKVYKPRKYKYVDDDVSPRRLLEELKKVYILEDDGTVTIKTGNAVKKEGKKKEPKKSNDLFDIFGLNDDSDDDDDEFAELEAVNDSMYDDSESEEDEDTEDEDDDEEEDEDDEESESESEPIEVSEEDERVQWENWMKSVSHDDDDSIETPAILQVSKGNTHHLADTVDDDDLFLTADDDDDEDDEEESEPEVEEPKEEPKKSTSDQDFRARVFAAAMKSFGGSYKDSENPYGSIGTDNPETVNDKPAVTSIVEEDDEEEDDKPYVTTDPEEKDQIPYVKPEVITPEEAYKLEHPEEESAKVAYVKDAEPITEEVPEETPEEESSDDEDEDDEELPFYTIDMDVYVDNDYDNHIVMQDDVNVISINLDYLKDDDPDFDFAGLNLITSGVVSSGLEGLRAWMNQTLIHFRPAVIMNPKEYETMMHDIRDYDRTKFIFFKLGTKYVAGYYVKDRVTKNLHDLFAYLLRNKKLTSFFKKYTRIISDTDGFSFTNTSQNSHVFTAMVNSEFNKNAIGDFLDVIHSDEMTVTDEIANDLGDETFTEEFKFANLESSSVFEDTFADSVYDCIDEVLHYNMSDEEVEELKESMGLDKDAEPVVEEEEDTEEPQEEESPEPVAVEAEEVKPITGEELMKADAARRGIDLSDPKALAGASLETFVDIMVREGAFDMMEATAKKFHELAVKNGVVTDDPVDTDKPDDDDLDDDEEEDDYDEDDFFPNRRKEIKHASIPVKPKNKSSDGGGNQSFIITRR